MLLDEYATGTVNIKECAVVFNNGNAWRKCWNETVLLGATEKGVVWIIMVEFEHLLHEVGIPCVVGV